MTQYWTQDSSNTSRSLGTKWQHGQQHANFSALTHSYSSMFPSLSHICLTMWCTVFEPHCFRILRIGVNVIFFNLDGQHHWQSVKHSWPRLYPTSPMEFSATGSCLVNRTGIAVVLNVLESAEKHFPPAFWLQNGSTSHLNLITQRHGVSTSTLSPHCVQRTSCWQFQETEQEQYNREIEEQYNMEIELEQYKMEVGEEKYNREI